VAHDVESTPNGATRGHKLATNEGPATPGRCDRLSPVSPVREILPSTTRGNPRSLWQLPNVLLSPHTAGLSVRENECIVALLGENLRRYLARDELLDRIHPALLY